MGPFIIPAIGIAALGGYWYYNKTRALPAQSAPPTVAAKKNVIESVKAAVLGKKGAKSPEAQTVAVKTEGLVSEGIDETQAAAAAFKASMTAAGHATGDIDCLGDFCVVEIDGVTQDAQDWFEATGAALAAEAAVTAGVEAALLVTGSKTYVVFADQADSIVSEAVSDGQHAVSLQGDAAATTDVGPDATTAGMGSRNGLPIASRWGYNARLPIGGQVPPGYGR